MLKRKKSKTTSTSVTSSRSAEMKLKQVQKESEKHCTKTPKHCTSPSLTTFGHVSMSSHNFSNFLKNDKFIKVDDDIFSHKSIDTTRHSISASGLDELGNKIKNIKIRDHATFKLNKSCEPRNCTTSILTKSDKAAKNFTPNNERPNMKNNLVCDAKYLNGTGEYNMRPTSDMMESLDKIGSVIKVLDLKDEDDDIKNLARSEISLHHPAILMTSKLILEHPDIFNVVSPERGDSDTNASYIDVGNTPLNDLDLKKLCSEMEKFDKRHP